jgi:hypothetical protein
MVKSSHVRESNDLNSIGGPRISGSSGWCIAERGVDALGVVVTDVLAEQTS